MNKELTYKWERKDWNKIKLKYQSNKKDCEKCEWKKECMMLNQFFEI